MMSRLSRTALLLTGLIALSACNQEAPAPAPATTPATPTAAPATTPATPAEATPTTPASAETARTGGPIVPPQGPAPVAGKDFVEVPNGQPFQTSAGQIEVAEVFGYTCPHCATFEPVVKAWATKLPGDVVFVPLAAPFGGYWMPYAKAFYAAQTMGLLDKTHGDMFKAIHIDRSLPVQPLPSDEQLAEFYAKYGADAKQFISTMSSFAVSAKMKRAEQFMLKTGVESTPTLVINGKYRVTGSTFEETLRIADHLIAQERAANTTPAAAPADAAAPAPAAGG